VDSAWTKLSGDLGFGGSVKLSVDSNALAVEVSVCKLEGVCQCAREDDFDDVTQLYQLNNDIRIRI